MAKNNWSREEHILAFNLYCKIPFTKINENYQPIKDLAQILGRTKGSIAMKMANFARLDPALKARNVAGLSQGAKGEEEVWNEFNGNWEELAFESERILAEYKKSPLELSADIFIADLPREGKEREAMVKLRVNQSFFRKTVLASYDTKCCITEISTPELLVAGHILPWATDIPNRVNPANGLCLNSLHDKAYDKGLITITPDFVIRISDKLLESTRKMESESFFRPFDGKKIILPQKFLPEREFLDYHTKNIFIA